MRLLCFVEPPFARLCRAAFGRGPRPGVALAFFLLTASSALLAQGFGSISGAVTDATGAVVPSANVVATQTETGQKTVATSNSSGVYVFPSVLPAEYTLAVTATGFEGYLRSGIVLLANQAATVNVQLKLGATSEVVEVAANAVQVDTTTGTLSQVIDGPDLTDRPYFLVEQA